MDALWTLMSPVELAATVLGLVSVWLTTRQNVWCWPTGIAMVVLYVWIFFQARLYSDMGLQVVYIGLQVYGWYFWVFGDPDRPQPPVTRIRTGEALGWLVAAFVGVAVLGTAMDRLTDADLAYPDAVTTVLSLIAQWLMARKVLESWLIWITVDVLSVGIYFLKDLYLTTGLYAVFLGLATLGYLRWRKDL